MCQKRAVGVVTGTKTDLKGRVVYLGKTLMGKPWQSVKPVVLANSMSEYHAQADLTPSVQEAVNTTV